MKKLSSESLRVLANTTVQGNLVTLPPGKLDRKLYVEVNQALESLGGSWNRKLQGHVFAHDPADALDQVVLNGGFVDHKKELGFFPTPADLSAEIVLLAKVRPGDHVLEPSAGSGSLAVAARKAGATVD